MRADSIVLKTIKEHGLINEGDILLLGLSGGPDSLCLLDILTKLQYELSFTLYALHVNHQIRGEAADADMMSAANACKQRDVPITIKLANIPEIAKREGTGEEETGRKVRQQALQKRRHELRAENPGCDVKIVLAHNKDDQAETVLMRIIRGTGVHGLGSMDYMRADGVIRPLLDVPRTDIEEYCSANGLRPCIDKSNNDLNYTRNRVRHQLMPLVEEEFNPNLKESLVRLADAAREDDRYIRSVAKESLPDPSQQSSRSQHDWDSMPRKQLASMDPAVAKRVITLMFERVGLKQDIASVHLKKLLDAVNTVGNSVIEFPRGYKAYVSYDTVSFRGPGYTQTAAKAKKRRTVNVSCLVMPIEEMPPIKALGPDICALDALKVLYLNEDLYVRTRQSGDRIKALNAPGTKKLQDYMTDRKIPREERDRIKLLCCDHTVLWIKGFTISDLCKIDEDTQFVLVTKIEED